MNRKKSLYILIYLISTLLAVFWQELGSEDERNRPDRQQGMRITADAASYTAPPINWIESGRWKDNSDGPSSYCQRPPGYGMVIAFCYLLAPQQYLTVLKIIQILAFLGSILLVSLLLKELEVKGSLRLIGILLYGLLPCYSSTMYFVLTEGITPLIVLAATFTWLRTIKNEVNPTWYIIIASYLLLIRPQVLVLVALMTAFLFIRRTNIRWYLPLIFLPLLSWQIRTYSYTRKWNLHPIYSEYNQSLYRPPHEAMTDLFRTWESDGLVFHGFISILQSDTTLNSLDQAMEEVPLEYRAEIRDIAREYQLLLGTQNDRLSRKEWLIASEKERTLTYKIDDRTRELRKEHLWDFTIGTPIKSAFYLLTKSHLHQKVFQQYWKGNVLVETIRIFCLIILTLSLLLSILLIFGRDVPASLKIVSASILLTIAYLVFFQRLNEERYLSPFLPLLFIGGIYMLSRFMSRNASGFKDK